MNKYPDDTEQIGGKKVRLLTLADLDGRTNAAKTARALMQAIESDLGGDGSLSAAERVLAHRAAIATAMCEDLESRWLQGQPIDMPAYTTLSNVVARLLRTVGLKRVAKDITPDLADYIEAEGAPSIPLCPVPLP